jgi:hypothetical protein
MLGIRGFDFGDTLGQNRRAFGYEIENGIGSRNAGREHDAATRRLPAMDF